MRLLNRSTRKIDLTEAGAIYFERCRHIVEEARVAHDQLLDMAVQPKGRLRISLPTSLAQLFLPSVIREFREQHPDIECDFDLGMRSVDPISNPFDLILRFGQQPDSSLISRKIVLMAHQLYASPEYLARHGEPRVPGDLSHHECLRPTMRDESSFWMLHSGDKVERVQVSAGWPRTTWACWAGWPARDWASRRCWCSTRWSAPSSSPGWCACCRNGA